MPKTSSRLAAFITLGLAPAFTISLASTSFAEDYKAEAAKERFTQMSITTHVFKPHELPPPSLNQLKVPEGFQISKFAENVGNARILAVAPNGTVYVSRREEADIIMFRGDGKDKPATFERVVSRAGLHGITFYEDQVYLATVHEVYRAKVLPNGHFGPLEMLIHDLPDAGQHNTRTVQIGPDKMMYISIGSTCNECEEPNPENAALLRASLDGKRRTIFASGLRDTIGWGWKPGSGELWGMDHGIDWMGDDMPEELNKLEGGKFYGWPFVFGDGKINPRVDASGGMKKSEYLKKSVPMTLGYHGHAAPMQLSFYNSTQFPKEYEGDAFIGMHGSWNRSKPSGYEVLRIRFKDGKATALEPFVTGFVSDKGESGRPVGTAITKDGSLLFTDDRNGIIYRVSYTGKETERAAAQAIPSAPMIKEARAAEILALASDREETITKGKLTVTSSAFADKGSIPAEYSALEHDASFPLAWTKGPSETKSYVLIMEDPNAAQAPLPFIHWLAWNIPASIQSLRPGLQKQPRITDPDGLRQGSTTDGHVGYRGPYPPAGDKPHNYSVQMFALDTELDLPPAADREQVLKAMKGHVVAKGTLVGTFKRPEKVSKP